MVLIDCLPLGRSNTPRIAKNAIDDKEMPMRVMKMPRDNDVSPIENGEMDALVYNRGHGNCTIAVARRAQTAARQTGWELIVDNEGAPFVVLFAKNTTVAKAIATLEAIRV